MRKLAKPRSKYARLALAALALWVSATTFFVLYNRYRYGADLDSISDLLLIAFAAPTATILAGLFFWLVGRRVSMAIIVASIALISVFVVWPAHQERQRRAELMRLAEQRKDEILQEATARCANEVRSPEPNVIDDYAMCIVTESTKIRREIMSQ